MTSPGIKTITESSCSSADSDQVLSEMLVRTSRTFALAIPCLPQPARREVTIAYLVFRIADTIEDADRLNRAEKLKALDNFAKVLCGDLPAAYKSLGLPRSPSDFPQYLALLDELPLVICSLGDLRGAARAVITDSALVSLAGMRRFIESGTVSGHVQIRSIEELREYCFLVAGVVGEMLTEIFIDLTQASDATSEQLRANARWFGEGLQLVNILKDSDEDRQDGREFIPQATTRGALFRLAREDLRKAEGYVRVLKQAESLAGVIAFTELPLLLAWRTLDCVEQFGPGSRVPRSEVLSILAQTHADAADRDSTQRTKKAAAK